MITNAKELREYLLRNISLHSISGGFDAFWFTLPHEDKWGGDYFCGSKDGVSTQEYIPFIDYPFSERQLISFIHENNVRESLVHPINLPKVFVDLLPKMFDCHYVKDGRNYGAFTEGVSGNIIGYITRTSAYSPFYVVLSEDGNLRVVHVS